MAGEAEGHPSDCREWGHIAQPQLDRNTAGHGLPFLQMHRAFQGLMVCLQELQTSGAWEDPSRASLGATLWL